MRDPFERYSLFKKTLDLFSIRKALDFMQSRPKEAPTKLSIPWIPSSKDMSKQMRRYRLRRKKLNRISRASRAFNFKQAAA